MNPEIPTHFLQPNFMQYNQAFAITDGVMLTEIHF